MKLQITFETSSLTRPQSRTDSGKLQEIALETLKDLLANKEHSKEEKIELKMDINIQNLSSPQEESFDMGDEAPLDVSVAVDPYKAYSYGI